jgi:S1-C subfamily serine protease
MKRQYLRLILSIGLLALLMLGFAAVAGAQDTPDTGAGRPFLGIRLGDSPDGIVIQEVLPESPAAAADLQVDDILTTINGEEVATAREAVRALRDLRPGDAVALGVMRGDESLSLEATLGSMRDERLQHMTDMLGIEYNAQDGTWQISSLSEDDALYSAGLREGDVITAINGDQLDPRGLLELTLGADPTDMVTLSVERDDSTQEIDVPVSALTAFGMFGGMPGIPEMIFPMPGMRGGDFGMGMMMPANGSLGVAFEMLTSELATELSVNVMEGAVVREVRDDSPAADAGLQVNDIITAVNGEPVDAERTLRDRLFAYEPQDVVTLSVLRAGETLDLEVTLGEPLLPHWLGMLEGRMPHGNMGRPAQPSASPNI